MKSVIIAAESPPAIPYITNITVMAAMATLEETKPVVLASITAPAPLSITPILIERFSIPTTANSIATLGLNLASKTSAVVMALKRRITGAISQ